MKPISSLVAAAALVLATPAFAHDYSAGDIAIIHPWIVEPPPGAQAAAGYGVIANDGAHDDRLLAVRTEAARMAE
ncbi:MAG: copper chaperone PCu(A)C, partial [Trueperaceae bacterium]|nr:copper chaperone PCu(A)C [Trueperaceae bacterium]